jgi:hypothetical protein
MTLPTIAATSGRSLLGEDVDVLSLGETGVLLVDRRTGASYAIGQAEKRLIELLAGDESLEEIVSNFSAQTDSTVSRRHVLEFVENLQRQGLIQGQAQTTGGASRDIAPHRAASSIEQASGRLNIVFDLLALLLGWIDHWSIVVAIGLAALLGANIVYRHPAVILQDIETFGRVCPFWVWIPFVEFPKLLLLDLVYTLVLGIVSRGRGANVRSFGIHLWQGVLPIFQLDLGASFALMSRRDRRALTWVSLLFPLAVGSLALLGWRMGWPGSWGSIACLLFAPAASIWFLVQANPFARGSSGQFLLCDLTREEDIQSWAMAETNAWILGLPRPRPLSSREQFWFRIYGLTYWLYRVALNVATLLIAWLAVFPRYGGPGAICVLIVLVYFNYDLLSAIRGAAPGRLRGRASRWDGRGRSSSNLSR